MVVLAETLVHSLIVFAVTYYSFCLKPKSNLRKKLICWSIVPVFLCLLSLEARLPRPNHYEVLQIVFPQTPSHDHYKRLLHSLRSRPEFHPGMAESLQLAYKTLSNSSRRDTYDHYGDILPDGINPYALPILLELSAMANSMIILLCHYLAALLFCFPPPFQDAKTLLALYSLGMFVVESQLRLYPSMINTDVLSGLGKSSLLHFEVIELTRRCFPVIFGVCLTVSALMYRELDLSSKQLLEACLISNKLLAEQISRLHAKGKPKEPPPEEAAEETPNELNEGKAGASSAQ